MKTHLAMPLGLFFCLLAGCPKGPEQTVWDLNRLDRIGSFATEVLGEPAMSDSDGRKAVCFDGKDDGLLLSTNPISGLHVFSIEILFRPDGDGPAEQRFLHIEDEHGRRALIETRVTEQRSWSLDTFMRATDTDKLTLLDRAIAQPTDRWYWAALVYDGRTMTHYVDGQKQLEGPVAFPPMSAGKISLGVRQNKVHWFKGCIAQVRFTPVALPPAALQRPN